MKINITLRCMIIIIILSACAPSNRSDASEATYKYLQALAEKDKTAVLNLACKAWEEQASLEVDALLSVGAELNNVQCQIEKEEGDYTLVKCSGLLDLTYDDEIRSIDLSKRTYYMQMEDGQWRVCSYK